MATQQSTYPTMLDIARRLDPNGKVADIVEMMNSVNEILGDAMFVECNNGTANLTTIRNGLPSVVWLRAYKGYTASKSTTSQVSDSTGKLGTRSEVDKMVLDRCKDKNAFRLSEAHPHIEAMNQEFASTLFYGNAGTDPDEFTGLALRFNAHTGTDSTKTSYNVIDGGGTGAVNTSIWLVGWGPRSVHCLYPEGSKVGLTHEDKGLESVRTEATGATYYAAVDTWDWDVGLAVRDWRYVARICNIDVSKTVIEGANAADLMALLIKAFHKVRRFSKGARFCIYCNKTILSYLDTQVYTTLKDKSLNYQTIDGQMVLTFRGMPIRECDAILDTEAAVSKVA